MLAKRIIPCLDVTNGRVVKGINFVALRDAGDPVEQAAIYSRERADELVFLDITASLESREVLLAKAAGMMKATMGKAAATIDALREKLETAEAA